MKLPQSFHIKINPWMLVGILGFISVFSLVQTGVVWYLSERRIDHVVNEMTEIKDKTQVNAILTAGDRRIKVTSHYSRIIAAYGNKYHPQNKPEYQGFTKEEKIAVINEVYEVSEILDIPFFTIMTVGKMESSFNPLARTTNDKGDLVEVGWLQMRMEAVAQAKLFFDQLPDEYKKRLAFTYNSMDDLYDPINSVRIMAVLLWGYKRMYQNQWVWAMTTYHWGSERIHKYYDEGITPTRAFVFNKGTLKEDVRDPFLYWHIFNAHNFQFERFEVDVYVDHSYVEAYLAECSKQEYAFIKQWKYFQDMLELAEDIKQDKVDFQDNQRIKMELWEERIEKANEEFRRAKGILDQGKFRTVYDVYKIGDIAVHDFLQVIKDEKVAKMQKLMLICFLVFVGILLMFSFIGMWNSSRYLYLKFKKRKLQQPPPPPTKQI